MKKAFDGQGKEIGSREMDEILATVLNNLSVTVPLTVERVQDEVERTLMERGHYEVAKAYILYREKRSALRRVRHTIARTVGMTRLTRCCAASRWILPRKSTPSRRFK
ncbi:MAG: ATP cone domain-containing protein [Flavonifractor plautii]